ncbi:MAG: hypothetical protein QOD42_3373 [Sphingomonadales bacterium]|jgi:hypothetical protein|nr:hypothetical protein [Sphingomonadales bacterium]
MEPPPFTAALAGMSEAAYLSEQAKRCRRLADGINDPKTVETLRRLADDYEKRALEAANKPAPRPE